MRSRFLSTLIIPAILAALVAPAASAAMELPTRQGSVPGPAAPNQGIVRAVLFWMEGCGHCHIVITQVLPPLKEKYGAKLDIVMVEVKDAKSSDRLERAATALGFQPSNIGVPFLIIGDQALVGSMQIPAELPGLIEKHLAAGGVDIPKLPGLESLSTGSGSSSTLVANGYTLAWLAMIALVFSFLFLLLAAGRHFTGRSLPALPRWLEQALPVLCLAGLVVAAYLAYVETMAAQAVCGPVGDCNALQASTYARLFGILPVGVLGLIGYVALLAAWLWSRLRKDMLAVYASAIVLAMALFGVLFSIYLTYLEIFVIHAVCGWCLASAVIMAAVLVVSTVPGLKKVDAG